MLFHPETAAPDAALVRESWRRFTQHGLIDHGVRPHIRNAWQRSRAHGCSPFMPRADQLDAAATIDLLKRESRLIELTAPFLSALSRAAGTDRHAAMLGDADGRVLKIVADPVTAADEAFPRAGSLLSEAAAGANGIGTPLADGHYVELVGPEHYIEGFHPFTCQGVPLQGLRGESIGVLSVSVRRVAAAHRIRDILFCATEAAECELLAAKLSAAVHEGALTGELLESLRQDVVQRIATTRLQLEIAARHIAEGMDASTTLQNAEGLIAKFHGQAAVWRNLADEATGSPEPIAVADLVHDFAGLMETEARVADVVFVEDRMDTVLALDDVHALTRRLLNSVLSALQRSDKPGALSFGTGTRAGEAIITLRGKRSGDQADFEMTITAPLLT